MQTSLYPGGVFREAQQRGRGLLHGRAVSAVVLLTDYAELIPDDGLPQWERDDLASMKNVAEHVKGPKFLKIAKDYYRSFPPVIRNNNLAQTKLTYTLKDALKALRLSPTPVSLQPVGAALLLKAVLGNKEAYLRKTLGPDRRIRG